MTEPIIKSLLDTDWYKFTMAQAVLAKHGNAEVVYTFTCRDKTQKLGYLRNQVGEQIEMFSKLKFTKDELDYLRGCIGMKSYFIDSLALLDLSDVQVNIWDIDDDLGISIVGPWIKAIWFEVPVLAIINELHSRNHKDHLGFMGRGTGALDVLEEKLKILNDYQTEQVRNGDPILKFMEFGTRRRYSAEIQDKVFSSLRTRAGCLGTSNVGLAKKYGVAPLGTMAHEWIQAGQAFGHPLDSQKLMMEEWLDVYGGDYNIALTDTLTSNKFLKDFKAIGNKFHSYRQDSGDPNEWAQNLLDYFYQEKIDPKTKTVVFSDNLSFLSAIELHSNWDSIFKSAIFGIGTNLSNDVRGHKALNIVIKLAQVNDRPVAKLSDNPSKAISSSEKYLEYLKEEIEYDTHDIVQERIPDETISF
jgi:nicotinate phosphoribosyltransferase